VERALKKVSKATTKAREGRETMEALLVDSEASDEALEKCPDVDALERELSVYRDELKELNVLRDALNACKSVQSEAFVKDAYERAKVLNVADEPPVRPPRVKKVKGPASGSINGPRKPYWTYVSIDGIDIRVGRTSEDNDRVSCDAECRDPRDWWMHAAGCPGSHVVIRYTGEDVPRETIVDAAVLAAANSKANQVGRAPVSLVRCRQVSKPRGAKAGLVQLSGDVKTVVVNVKDEASRLERLMSTKQ
jgi:predicted ribosome quality control (RQC) complex YloA/Tae2 family protein